MLILYVSWVLKDMAQYNLKWLLLVFAFETSNKALKFNVRVCYAVQPNKVLRDSNHSYMS